MGAVFAHRKIYDAFMQGPENVIELFHGYTYSAHRSPARPPWPLWTSTPRKDC